MKFIFSILFLLCTLGNAQILNHKGNFTQQDSLRGSNNSYRNWWNVTHYDLEVEPFFEKKFIQGKNTITFDVLQTQHSPILQIDLQEPMEIDEVILNQKSIKGFKRNGNVYFINTSTINLNKENNKLEIKYSGHPKVAKNAPWDGGWIFTHDQQNRPWMSVACQGLGASVWYPNKDYLGDEPENGASLAMIVPEDLIAVANGRLVDMKLRHDNKLMFKWAVKNTINNYNLVPYIGHYTEIKDQYNGKKGDLDLRYWVLDYNREIATNQFKQTHDMLNSFEHWFGPYPFYEDSFKLIEAPHLGMEHQSGIAYGNYFQNGYLQRDLSGSGWGLKWDFILVHEAGHEWFGNSITCEDIADMWIHESFTAYSETLHTEQLFGKEAGNDYVIGTRQNILNDKPMIGVYGVNQEGSGDIYYKGANMIHTLRQWINDDEKFRSLLLAINENYFHKNVSSAELETFIASQLKLDLTAFFDQYLRTTKIPILEYKLKSDEISYRWTNVVDGFEMPVKIKNSTIWLKASTEWKTEKLPQNILNNFSVDRNLYIETKLIP